MPDKEHLLPPKPCLTREDAMPVAGASLADLLEAIENLTVLVELIAEKVGLDLDASSI